MSDRELRCAFLVGRDPLHPQAGGGDVQAWNWASWLAHQGASVTYLCQTASGLPREEIRSGVKILRLGSGVRLPVEAALWLVRNREAVDLVYEDPVGAGRVPYLSPLYSRRPTIAVWHQVSRELFRELYGAPVAEVMSGAERLVSRLYRRCWFWAPSSEVAAEVVRSFGFQPERVGVVHPTAEPVAETSPTSIDGGPSEPLVTALGVIRRYKALDHLVRSLPAVSAAVPTVRVIVAGRRADRAYEEELRSLVVELGVEDRVEFRLDLSEGEKASLLRRSSVLAVASKLEGYGIVTIEANHFGVPVVASSGVPLAAVDDGVNGLRYPYGDIDKLGECLVKVLSDPSLAASLRVRAKDHAATRTVASQAPAFESLLENAGCPIRKDA